MLANLPQEDYYLLAFQGLTVISVKCTREIQPHQTLYTDRVSEKFQFFFS